MGNRGSRAARTAPWLRIGRGLVSSHRPRPADKWPTAAEATVKELWRNQSGRWMAMSLVAFLRADSNSCAVFAAATIEFIGEFNV